MWVRIFSRHSQVKNKLIHSWKGHILRTYFCILCISILAPLHNNYLMKSLYIGSPYVPPCSYITEVFHYKTVSAIARAADCIIFSEHPFASTSFAVFLRENQ